MKPSTRTHPTDPRVVLIAFALVPFLFASVRADIRDDPGQTPMEGYEHRDLADLRSAVQIGGDAIYGPQPFSQYEPEMTFDGVNYFVTWISEDPTGQRVCAARVSTSGLVLDRMAIRVQTASHSLSSPVAASSQENYLIVWTEWCIEYTCPDILGARVSKDGTLLDQEPIVISGAAGYQTSPRVAFDGTNYLVVWNDTREGGDGKIYGARVSPSGTVLDPEGFSLSNRPGSQGSPELSFDGTNCVVIWNEYVGGSGIVATRVTPDGEVLDPDGIPIAIESGGKSFPTIAFDGANYMVAWIDWRYADWTHHDVTDVYCAIVSPDGHVIFGDIPVCTVGYTKYALSLDFDGENYVIVWDDERDYERHIYAARVTQCGTVIDTQEIEVTTGPRWQSDCRIAFGGDDYLIVWQGDSAAPAPTTSIQGTRFTPSASILDPSYIAISMEANWQLSPALAFDGDTYMAVWTDYRSDSVYTRAARITPSGRIVDPGGIRVSATAGLSSEPALAFDGTNYMVAWEDARRGAVDTDICLARVSPQGQVLAPDTICVSTEYYEQENPDIAFDGENYLLVWGHRRYSWDPMPTLVRGVRVSPAGEVLDSEYLEISGSDHADRPAVAFDGTNYLVVWGTLTIQGSRVSRDGAVLDPDLPAVVPPGSWQQFPDIAFDGSNYFVVWMEKRPTEGGSGEQFDVLGARIDPSLSRLDEEAILISTVAGDQRYPRVVFDGSDYIVTWMDWRAEGETIRGNIVTPGGEVIYPDGFPISSGGEEPSTPATALGENGQILFVHSAFTPGPPFDCPRIWANLWGEAAIGTGVELTLNRTPFNSSVRISYRMPDLGKVNIEIYDVMGRLVRSLLSGDRGPGWQHETWDGRDEEGRSVPSGVYFVAARSAYGGACKKCVLAR